MILAIQGTRTFNKYESVFLRGMGRALSMLNSDDKTLTVYTAGPANINSMAMEFINITERSLNARGVKTRVNKVSPSWIKQNIGDVDLFLYFCSPKESYSEIYDLANRKNIDAEVYRY